MKTFMLLMVQYDGELVVPAERVRQDYFPHLDRRQFLRKINEKAISLPHARGEGASRLNWGISIQDLAQYIDDRRAVAVRECLQSSVNDAKNLDKRS